MERYTKKDADGRYYIESVNGRLESDKYGHTYGEAIEEFARLENSSIADKATCEKLKSILSKIDKVIQKQEETMQTIALEKQEYFTEFVLLKEEKSKNFDQWERLDNRTKERYAELYEEAKKVVRKEAIKEFAERFKRSCGSVKTEGKSMLVCQESSFDYLVKEMTEVEDNGNL